MRGAIKLLFETKFNGKPLFANQLDLVNALLNDPKTRFHTQENDPESFAKAQNRLKAYVSQVLSSTVSRNITEDFIIGLKQVISSRLHDDMIETDKIVSTVIEEIREKNSTIGRAEIKTTPLDQLISDLDSAQYVAVITSRPLEIEIPNRGNLPNLRQILFSDLISQLYEEQKELKSYRFNFPTEAFCDLFWRGLRRILFRQFMINPSPQLFKSLNAKLNIEIKDIDKLSDLEVQEIVHNTLIALNSRKFILVFTTFTPIYGFPIVAIDPSDTVNNKVYTILDSERMSLLKFPENETLLWRLFVWDLLKSKKYAGTPIPYSNDLS